MARKLAGFAFFVCLTAPTLVSAQNKDEGQKLYTTYCSSCHGDSGKGDGPAAASLPVKPANHTDGNVMNKIADKTLFEIISKGGPAGGKSNFMPAWGGALKENQIQDVVAYLRSIANPPYKGGSK